MVWHGQTSGSNLWTELTTVTVDTNAYVRLTVMADYTRDTQGAFGFQVWINKQLVTQPATWFKTASTNHNYLSSVELTGTGQVDDMVVDDYNSMLYRPIRTSAGAHGRVAPAGEFYVPVGASTNVAVVPDAYYKVGAVAVDGEAAGAPSVYTFTDVWDEHTLAAEFAERLTSSGVPELWLHGLNPLWTDNFEAHAKADTDGDGVPNEQEYVAGTDATNRLSVFAVSLAVSNGLPVVSFPTVPAGGFYGLGGVRRYALEAADDLSAGNWQGVAGLDNVPGSGRPVVYTNQLEGAGQRFFRGRVWLSP